MKLGVPLAISLTMAAAPFGMAGIAHAGGPPGPTPSPSGPTVSYSFQSAAPGVVHQLSCVRHASPVDPLSVSVSQPPRCRSVGFAR